MPHGGNGAQSFNDMIHHKNIEFAMVISRYIGKLTIREGMSRLRLIFSTIAKGLPIPIMKLSVESYVVFMDN